MLLNYAAASVMYAHQTCLCYRYHSLEQQVIKIILLTLLRTGRSDIEFTHQGIATILGVRREGISTALQQLQDLGLIDKSRGLIQVLQKKALEAHACECYALLRHSLGYN
jgi:CRP-like cAMP-binding protein